METTPSPLHAILEAGSITADEDVIARLARALSALGWQYRHEIRFAREWHGQRKQLLLDRLSSIRDRAAAISSVINDDPEIELLLDNAPRWRAEDAPHLNRRRRKLRHSGYPRTRKSAGHSAALHELRLAADQAIELVEQNGPDRPALAPNEQSETWLFVELREVYKRLSGRKEIGRDGPLDRFIRLATVAIGKDIPVPNPGALTALLRAALARKRRPVKVETQQQGTFTV
jgi:hypothetical protein